MQKKRRSSRMFILFIMLCWAINFSTVQAITTPSANIKKISDSEKIKADYLKLEESYNRDIPSLIDGQMNLQNKQEDLNQEVDRAMNTLNTTICWIGAVATILGVIMAVFSVAVGILGGWLLKRYKDSLKNIEKSTENLNTQAQKAKEMIHKLSEQQEIVNALQKEVETSTQIIASKKDEHEQKIDEKILKFIEVLEAFPQSPQMDELVKNLKEIQKEEKDINKELVEEGKEIDSKVENELKDINFNDDERGE